MKQHKPIFQNLSKTELIQCSAGGIFRVNYPAQKTLSDLFKANSKKTKVNPYNYNRLGHTVRIS